MTVLKFEADRFGGAVINSDDLPVNWMFKPALENTITYLKGEGFKLLWLFLPPSQAELVPLCVNAGFFYHHADEGGIELCLRLVPGAFVPGYATHYIGAGGVLIDEENRILVIQEKHHTRRHYKLPGGALDPGEHISDAVVREVKEETGIDSEFLSLNCFRHWHGYRYGKSDIYFVCRLKPLSSKIKIDPSEISEALWMDLDEYLNHPDTHPFNSKIVTTALKEGGGLKIDTIEDYGTPETHEMMFDPPAKPKAEDFT
ncbi:MAG: NUDIX domain-containing protein [Spirochaetales bacterium]|nr:NUDIX domain-containing protein [Spirochaetales bacterium]